MIKRCAWWPVFAISILLSLVFATGAEAEIIVSTTGDWSLSVGSSDLQSGAGSDLIADYDNAGSPGIISIAGTSGDADAWRIDVRRVDLQWDSGLTLRVKRISDGLGGGSVSGGESYLDIGLADFTFFSGLGDRSGVQVQFQLSGVSLQLPPDTYSTTIVYTVVDL